MFQTRKLVLKLGSSFFVLVKGGKSFEESIIISKQWGIGFEEGLTLFGGDTTEMGDDEGDA